MLQQNSKSKIVYAASAVWTYIQMIHRPGIDRGLIATFGDKFRIEADFTTSLPTLTTTLSALMNGARNEGTRLYDSLEDMVNTFWKAGRRDCRWDALVFTDGKDNRSTRYPFQNPNTPELIGRYIGSRFNHEPTNRVTLFGVGSEQQLNSEDLATVGQFGNFYALRVDAFPLLEEYLKRFACGVTEEVEDVYIDLGGGFVVRGQNKHRRVTRLPVDYMVLLDVSGSMAGPATQG